MIGLSVQDATFGTATTNLGISDAPPGRCSPADAIRSRTTVTALRPSSSRPGQGIVTFEHVGLNQRDDKIVCRSLRSALMMARPADA
ncbi:hypothetical protein AB5I41_08425 [Sphingomonas sp. MMS24-JH45]